MAVKKCFLFAVLLSVFCFTGCSDLEQSQSGVGHLDLAVSYSISSQSGDYAVLSQEWVDSAVVTLTKDSTVVTENLTKSNGSFSGLIENLDTGEWSVTVNIYSQNDVLLLTGNESALIEPGETTSLVLVLSNASPEDNGDLELSIHIPVMDIAAGESHSMVLKADGQLWMTGNNDAFQFGIFHSNTSQWTSITTNVIDIAAGQNTSFMVKSDNTLWGTGVNTYGALGLGDNSDRTHWTLLMGSVESVYTSGWTVFVKTTSGVILAAGFNNGMMGTGSTNHRETFVNVQMSDVEDISVGNHSTMVLRTDGSLWVAGQNNHGQLGLGNVNSQVYWTFVTTNVQAVSAGHHHNTFLKEDGTLYGTGKSSVEYYSPLGIGEESSVFDWTVIMEDVDTMSAGDGHTLVLKENGAVYGAGFNTRGQLALGHYSDAGIWAQSTVPNTVSSVFCEGNHSFLLLNDYSILGTGQNTDGQLGTLPLVNLPIWTDSF